MRTLVDIVVEPRGAVYRALLDFGRQLGSTASLVWRDQLELDPSANVIADRLSADLVREERVAEWPGTRLHGSRATLRIFRLSSNAVAVLSEAEGLYDWRAPGRPEDLAMYSNDGRAWLGSIAHERDGFLDAEVFPVPEVADQVPGLRLRRRKR